MRSAYKDFESFLRREEIWNLKLSSGSKNTPKNLIAGVGWFESTRDNWVIFSATFWPSLLLSQTTMTFCVILRREKIINFVLSECNTSLLVLKNSQTFLSSVFTMLIRTFRSSWENSNVVSSANNNVRNLDARGKSFIYKRKSRGPKMDPWGTPRVISKSGLAVSLI